MFCKQCGTYNPDHASFCGGCGNRLDKATGTPAGNIVSHPTTPLPEVLMSSGQVPFEHMPTVQDIPPSGGDLLAPGNPPVQFITPTGYGMPSPVPPMPSSPSHAPESLSPYNVPPPLQYWGLSAPLTPLPPVQQPPFNQAPPPTEVYEPGSPSSAMYPIMPQAPVSQSEMFNFPYSGAIAPAAPPTVVRIPWYRTLAKPLPLLAFIGSIILVVLLLVILQITGSDWAVGALHLGITAGIIAVLIVLVTGVRSVLGMAARTNPKRLVQFISASVSFLILMLLFLVGLTQQSTIHSLQAHNWEGQQQWQSAINEFQLAGEGAPTSNNIARIYNEWGEQFSTQQRYPDAFAKFDIVLNNYSSATAEVARAQSDKVATYLNWGKQADQQKDYASATMRYDALLQLPYCNSNCQNEASALDATAYYNLAETQLMAQQYSDAINNFQVVLTRFGSSPEAHKLHGDLAKSLFGQGQQQLTTSCPSAIPTYQQLSTQFADTPEGQKAATALNAPQAVKGHFTGSIPNNPSLARVAALIKGLYVGIPSAQLSTLFYSSPQTPIASDGSFTFSPQPQGSYDLAWGTIIIATGAGILSFNPSRYVANVGPLCPYDFGDIPADVLAAQ